MSRLSQLDGSLFLTDGGIETDLIFNKGAVLPEFAFVPPARGRLGRVADSRVLRGLLPSRRGPGLGLVLETATWRASRDWGLKLGYDAAQLRAVNQRAVEFMVALRAAEHKAP